MYREVKFTRRTQETQLNRNITVAPLHQSYALCVEYMRHWFLQKFKPDFFSWVHTDGSHVFGEMAKIVKKEKTSSDAVKEVLDIVADR